MSTEAEDLKSEIEDLKSELDAAQDVLSRKTLARFDDYLDETHAPIEAMGLRVMPSRFLKEHSPTDYGVYLSEWEDPEVERLLLAISELQEELEELLTPESED